MHISNSNDARLSCIIPTFALGRSDDLSKLHLSLYSQALNDTDIWQICNCIRAEIKLHNRSKKRNEPLSPCFQNYDNSDSAFL